MAGVSRHFDHLTGKTVSVKRAFKRRSNISVMGEILWPKRYQDSLTVSKPEMAANMINRALNKSFAADYLLADAWYGNKTTLRSTQATDLTAILQMKKDKMRYRYSDYSNGKQHVVMVNAQELYSHHARKQWQKTQGTHDHCKALDIALNLLSSA